MLKTNNFKSNQVVCFKLVSGEEVIAKIKSEDDSTFVLTSARTLVAMQQGAGLAPIASMGDPAAELQMHKASIMFTYSPTAEIEGKYTQEVSPIATANKGKIIS